MLDSMAIMVGDAVRAATTRLKAAGYASSDAEELLSRLLGVGRGELRRRLTDTMRAETVLDLSAQLMRREAGEPVQYITGRAAFRHIDLAVDRRVLIPRPETELLVDAVLEYLANRDWSKRPPRVLDLGTGSGCIALAIAHEHPIASLTATDTNADALDVARANASALGLASRVTFAHGEWFDAVGADDRYDVVVSNPPYISNAERELLPADVRDWEPRVALFADDDGLADVRDILEDAPRHLL